MTISYFWAINPLECYPTASGETDVVFTAHWQFHAIAQIEDEVYRASTIGTQALTYEAGTPFTPFHELTLEQVSGWVENAMGEEYVNKMKADLAQQIESQINPPVLVLTSPWLSTPSGSI